MTNYPKDKEELFDWLIENKIDEVECLIYNMTGIARGKIIPCDKFISGFKNDNLFIPDAILNQLVTGEYCDKEYISIESSDMRVIPDPTTVRIVPWYDNTPVAQIICDVENIDGSTVDVAPRQVLKYIKNVCRYVA